MVKHYNIDGTLYPASDWANWAAVDSDGLLYEYLCKPSPARFGWWFANDSVKDGYLVDLSEKIDCNNWASTLTPATTELDRLCLKVYGSMFDKVNTDTQRILEHLYDKGVLKV